MKSGQEARRLIKLHEGLSLTTYKDAVGIPTCGYGHALRSGEQHITSITQEEADKFLEEDIVYAERAINDQITVPLTQNQFDALVSFVFNVGAGNLASSTLKVVLNDKCYDRIPVEMLKWIHANKKPLPGLIKRRADEALLFMKRDSK